MVISVNSETTEFSGKNIVDLLEKLELASTQGMALAVNEKIVPKTEWEKYSLCNNDKVLLIKATQGG